MTTITLEPRPGADPQDKETETLTGEATRRIRQFILDGELEPNARLNEVQLCDSLSISRTPLRAAPADPRRRRTIDLHGKPRVLGARIRTHGDHRYV